MKRNVKKMNGITWKIHLYLNCEVNRNVYALRWHFEWKNRNKWIQCFCFLLSLRLQTATPTTINFIDSKHCLVYLSNKKHKTSFQILWKNSFFFFSLDKQVNKFMLFTLFLFGISFLSLLLLFPIYLQTLLN